MTTREAIIALSDLMRSGYLEWNDDNKIALAKLYEASYARITLAKIPLYQSCKRREV